MPGRTQGEKVDDLLRTTGILTARLDTLYAEVGHMAVELSRLRTELATLTTRTALLEHQMGDLRKGNEEWGRRLWTILGPILGALVGGVIGYFLNR